MPYERQHEKGSETLHDFFFSNDSETLDEILSTISTNPDELKNEIRFWLKRPQPVNTRSLAKQLHTPSAYHLKKKFPV